MRQEKWFRVVGADGVGRILGSPDARIALVDNGALLLRVCGDEGLGERERSVAVASLIG